MKLWKVSRYAEDPPIPAADALPEDLAELPLDENCEEMAFFPISRDKKSVRRRNYRLSDSGELECFLDRPATDDEVKRVFEILDRLTAEGHEGVHGIEYVDESVS